MGSVLLHHAPLFVDPACVEAVVGIVLGICGLLEGWSHGVGVDCRSEAASLGFKSRVHVCIVCCGDSQYAHLLVVVGLIW